MQRLGPPYRSSPASAVELALAAHR